jgi:WhiB family transcriptional regulator, redox-sensing transcriptional regulator
VDESESDGGYGDLRNALKAVGGTRDRTLVIYGFTAEELEWRGEALCIGNEDLFFPGRGQDTAIARQLCVECPSRIPCLVFAMENNEKWGIWGGFSEHERRWVKGEVRRGKDLGEAITIQDERSERKRYWGQTERTRKNRIRRMREEREERRA